MRYECLRINTTVVPRVVLQWAPAEVQQFWENCWTSPVALIWTVLCTQKELGLQIWRGFRSWMKFWKNIFLRVFSHVDMTKSQSSARTSGQISNFREKSPFFKFFQRFRARWSTKISKIINSFDWDVDLSIIPYGTDLHGQRSSLGLSNPY